MFVFNVKEIKKKVLSKMKEGKLIFYVRLNE